jgi:hypothetical protein
MRSRLAFSKLSIWRSGGPPEATSCLGAKSTWITLSKDKMSVSGVTSVEQKSGTHSCWCLIKPRDDVKNVAILVNAFTYRQRQRSPEDRGVSY